MELTQEQRNEYKKLVNGKFSELGKFQHQVAEELGLSPNFISEALRGPRDNMQMIPTMRLLAYLGISYDQVAQILGITQKTERNFRVESICTALSEVSPDVLSVVESIIKNAPRNKITEGETSDRS